MCWSPEVSILSWAIGLISGLYLVQRNKLNDRPVGMLILAYSSMQLWEALMWWDQKCGNLNRFATVMAYFALWSHVLAIGVGLYWQNKKVVIPMIIGFILMIAALILLPRKWECSKPTLNSKGHLVWGFPETFYMVVFAIAIIIAVIYIRPIWVAFALSALFCISFLISWLITSEAVGSFWCWTAAIFSMMFVFANSGAPNV